MVVQHLIVEEFGSYVTKHSERLVVTKKSETITQAPLLSLQKQELKGAKGLSCKTETRDHTNGRTDDGPRQ